MDPTYPAISDSGDVVALFNGPLFPKPRIISAFEGFGNGTRADLALVELLDLLEFDIKRLGAILRGETPGGILKDLPRIVDLSTDGEPRRIMVLVHSAIQRIVILDARARLAAWFFTPYCWDSGFRVFEANATINPNLHYVLHDGMIQEVTNDFVAQSLFSVDHNLCLPPPVLRFVEMTTDNLTSTDLTSKDQLLSIGCKLFVLMKNLDDPMTLSAVILDFLISVKINKALAMEAVSWIAQHCGQMFSFTAQVAHSDIWRELSMLSMVLCSTVGSQKLPCNSMVNFVTKRLGDLGRAANGYKTIVELFGSVFSKVYDCVYEFIFGVPPKKDQLDIVAEELEVWYNQVTEVIPMAFQDEIPTDFRKNRTIQQLYTQGLELSRIFNRTTLSREEVLPFNRHWAALQRVYDKVISQGARLGAPRTEPVCIHIYGDSGVGKSGLTHLLSQDICAIEGFAKEVCNETYFRSVEQEFWDGYHGQLVCVYDDFGQRRDIPGDPNPEFMELIRSRNIAPFPLHMAHLDEKARTKFVSRALILTSNKKNYNIGSVTCAEAIWRRIDLQVKVEVLDEYRGKNGMIDVSRTKGTLDSDVYRFTLMDPTNDSFVGQSMNYSQFVRLVQQKYRSCYMQSKEKLEFLENRGRELDNNFVAQTNPEEIRQIITLDQILFPVVWMHVRDGSPLSGVEGAISREVLHTLIDFARSSVDFHEFSLRSIMYFDANNLDLLREIDCNETLRVIKDKLFSHPDNMFKAKTKNVFTTLKNGLSRLKESLYKYWDLVRENKTNIIFRSLQVVELMAHMYLMYRIGKWSYNKSLEMNGYSTETRDEVQVKRNNYVTETKDEDQVKRNKFITETKDENQVSRGKFVTEDRSFTGERVSDVEEFFDVKEKMRKRNKKKFIPEASLDQNAQQLMGPFASNTYILYTWKNDEWTRVVNAVMIKGRVMLIVAHARVMLRERCLLRGMGVPEGFEFRFSQCSTRVLQNSRGDDIDAMLVELPRIVVLHKNIVGHFMTTKDLQLFRSVPAYLLSMRALTKGKQCVVTPITQLFSKVSSMETQQYRMPGSDEQITLREGYVYNAETEPGDCSSLLVARAPGLPRKILGIHVAGNNDGRALSQLITQKMLLNALEHFSFEGQVAYETIEDVEFDVMPTLPDGDFVPVGVLKRTVPSSPKTSLRHSALHGLWMEPKTAPAVLGPVKRNGITIDPLTKGLKKCGTSASPIDDELLQRCKTAVGNSLCKKTTFNRVLTYEEAIKGVEDDPFMRPVNRRTSPGYPFIFDREGHRGKTKWLGSDETYILDNKELKEMCMKRIDLAKDGIRTPALWIDTLKDERRPKEKIEQVKTRVFSAGPMDFILVFRQYFLAFNAHMMRGRIYNGCAVGVNPYSAEWHELGKYLQGVGNNIFAGDFSNFDGTLHPEILWSILDIVNKFYDDGEENCRIRTVLFAEIVNSIHIMRDNVYMMTHSQPSGNPFTTVLNVCYNEIAFMYVFVEVTGESLRTYQTSVRVSFFGDDSLVSVSDTVRDGFNQETVELGFKTLGMVYTDANKTGELVKWKPLEKVNFLKRDFRFDPDLMRYVAPLDLDVVLEMPMWVKSDLDVEERCSSNLEKTYGELALHGEEIFQHWSSIMNAHANEHLEEPPVLLHYIDYKEMDLNQI